jgi:hypothetical protein
MKINQFLNDFIFLISVEGGFIVFSGFFVAKLLVLYDLFNFFGKSLFFSISLFYTTWGAFSLFTFSV